jgi:hypothetical protein
MHDNLYVPYGILYLFFVAYPIAFRQVKNWKSLGIAALLFLEILIGVLMGCLLVTIVTGPCYTWIRCTGGLSAPHDCCGTSCACWVILVWLDIEPNILWVPQAIAGVPTGIWILVIWI